MCKKNVDTKQHATKQPIDHWRNQRGKHLGTNENESTTIQNAKVFLIWKFLGIQYYLRKQEKSQINSLILYLKHPKKEEERKPKVGSVQFSHSVMSSFLQTHGLQHARPPCPSQLPEFTQTHVHWVGDSIVIFFLKREKKLYSLYKEKIV